MKRLNIKNVVLFVLLHVIVGLTTIIFTSFIKSSSQNSIADNMWKWEEMHPEDMREAIETMPVAWMVISPLEWHGEAMAFGTDPVIGQHVVDNAWSKVGGVRIPTLLVGAETDYKYWGEDGLSSHWGLEQVTKEHNHGSLYVRPVTLKMIVEDYLYFLKREGFKLVIFSTGHGAVEHVQVIREVCEQFSDDEFKAVFYPYWDTVKTPDELKFEGSGGHADYAELSLLGAVDPNLVKVEKFGLSEQDRKVKLLSENKEKIDFEKAKKLIEFRAENMAKEVQKMIDELD